LTRHEANKPNSHESKKSSATTVTPLERRSRRRRRRVGTPFSRSSSNTPTRNQFHFLSFASSMAVVLSYCKPSPPLRRFHRRCVSFSLAMMLSMAYSYEFVAIQLDFWIQIIQSHHHLHHLSVGKFVEERKC